MSLILAYSVTYYGQILIRKSVDGEIMIEESALLSPLTS